MSALWAERHYPCAEAQLVVQKRKVQEVRAFLSSPQRLLILRGPPGSGKAAALHAVCGDLGLEVVEWTQGAAGAAGDSLLRFLSQADAYRALSKPRRRVALVRDFPFTLIDGNGTNPARAAGFMDKLASMLQQGSLLRAVLCFNNSREEYRIITKLTVHLNSEVQMLQFDSVARTFAQKALDGIAQAEGFDPSAVGVARVAAECGGDLRQAINALQLAAGWASTSRGKRSARPARSKVAAPRRASGETPGLAESCLRDASLGFFHALGRLLYNKRVPPEAFTSQAEGVTKRRRKDMEPRQLPHSFYAEKCARPPLYFTPEEVMESAADPVVTAEWLFSNAPRFYADVGDLAEFARIFADVDAWRMTKFGTSQSQEELLSCDIAASVQARAVLDSNLHPVPPRFSDPGNPLLREEGGGGLSFNMVKPRSRDTSQHRDWRTRTLATHLEGLHGSGYGCIGTSSTARQILPFMHLMMSATQGTHATLSQLPHSFMNMIMNLCQYHGYLCLDEAAANGFNQDWSYCNQAFVPEALADDPIEMFDDL